MKFTLADNFYSTQILILLTQIIGYTAYLRDFVQDFRSQPKNFIKFLTVFNKTMTVIGSILQFIHSTLTLEKVVKVIT